MYECIKCFDVYMFREMMGIAHLQACPSIHGVVWGISHSLKVDDPNLLGLTNPVGPGNCLLLVLWVGVRVVHHHCVGRLQVEPPASCPYAQQEDEDLAVRGVEPLDSSLPAELL